MMDERGKASDVLRLLVAAACIAVIAFVAYHFIVEVPAANQASLARQQRDVIAGQRALCADIRQARSDFATGKVMSADDLDTMNRSGC
jgi:hypothetical protein